MWISENFSTKTSLLFTTADIGQRTSDMGAATDFRSAEVRFPMSDVRFFSRSFSRFLASYSAHFFLHLSTIVHTAFQRSRSISSRCHHTHLAHSPHWSTCAINMNDNNLRERSLLRQEIAGSTLRTPRSNCRAPHRPSSLAPTRPSSCSFFPAALPLEFWRSHRALRCATIPRWNAGKVSGAYQTRATTSVVYAATTASSGIASRMKSRPRLKRRA